ncbi:MAG: DUF4393 domain-containing protein [Nitrospirae bacterium]|nr:DUF4393 domain-containing protein [Nitrospirota bacterium]
MADDNLVKSTAEVVKAVVDKVPVYQDVLQPAAKEVGKALSTVAKTIHIALAPLSALVWGYDQISEYLTQRLSELLHDIPPDRIATPPANIAGPALQALRFTASEPDLREMFARLLAASMDTATQTTVHPAFVETIKQLSADEARILSLMAKTRYHPQPLVTLNIRTTPPFFPETGQMDIHRNLTLVSLRAGVISPALESSYFDNLSRLGLILVKPSVELLKSDLYKEYDDHPEVKKHLDRKTPGITPVVRRGSFEFSDFGQQFVNVCISPKVSN